VIERNFISQPSALIKSGDTELPSDISGQEQNAASGRVVMTDFDVFHNPSKTNRKLSAEAEDEAAQLYQQGLEAGKAEAAAVYEQTVKVMEMTLDQLKTRLESQVKEIEYSHARVVTRCLEAVLPETGKQVLLAEMSDVLNRFLEADIQGELTARIHPENETAKSFLQSKTNHPVKIIEDENISLSKVTFTWENSQTEMDPGQAVETCLALLKSSLDAHPASLETEIHKAEIQSEAEEARELPSLSQFNTDPLEEVSS